MGDTCRRSVHKGPASPLAGHAQRRRHPQQRRCHPRTHLFAATEQDQGGQFLHLDSFRDLCVLLCRGGTVGKPGEGAGRVGAGAGEAGKGGDMCGREALADELNAVLPVLSAWVQQAQQPLCIWRGKRVGVRNQVSQPKRHRPPFRSHPPVSIL